MAETFKRQIENFVCENCGIEVIGNGYSDHCPQCLYSKHVDIYPGDRAANCGGLMKPTDIAPNKSSYKISYTCLRCGYEYSNKSAQNDDITEFLNTHNPFSNKSS